MLLTKSQPVAGKTPVNTIESDFHKYSVKAPKLY